MEGGAECQMLPRLRKLDESGRVPTDCTNTEFLVTLAVGREDMKMKAKVEKIEEYVGSRK